MELRGLAKGLSRDYTIIAESSIQCLEKAALVRWTVPSSALFELARATFLVHVYIREKLKDDRKASRYCDAVLRSIAEAGGCSVEDLLVLQRAKVAAYDLMRVVPNKEGLDRVLSELLERIGIDYQKLKTRAK